MIEAIAVTDRSFGNWWRHASWERKLLVYTTVVLTISMLVQVIATLLLGGLHG